MRETTPRSPRTPDRGPGRTPPRVRLILLVYVLLIVTNIFDAWATLGAVANGAEELNPVMRAALDNGPIAFFASKMLLVVTLGGLLAATAREHALAWRGLCGLCVVYTLVFAWHVSVLVFGPALAFSV